MGPPRVRALQLRASELSAIFSFCASPRTADEIAAFLSYHRFVGFVSPSFSKGVLDLMKQAIRNANYFLQGNINIFRKIG